MAKENIRLFCKHFMPKSNRYAWYFCRWHHFTGDENAECLAGIYSNGKEEKEEQCDNGGELETHRMDADEEVENLPL